MLLHLTSILRSEKQSGVKVVFPLKNKTGSVYNNLSFTEAKLRKLEYQGQRGLNTDLGATKTGIISCYCKVPTTKRDLELDKIKSKVYFFWTAQPVLP